MKKLMMIVDDNRVLLENMKDYFSDKYDIILCNEPNLALKRLGQSPIPSIIITDQQMPNMTGLDLVIKAIKTWPQIKSSTLLIMSAFSGSDGGESIQAAKREGIINGFICKSTPLKNYEALIDDALVDHERRRKDANLQRELKDLKEKHETLVVLNIKRVDQEQNKADLSTQNKNKKAA